MKTLNISVFFLGTILLASSGIAQTTLPGGSEVDGSFSVGNSTNKGGLTITGQTGNAAVPGIKVTGDGGISLEGTYGTGLIPATGGGTRLMWYPKKAAFRVGRVDGANWDDANIGAFSAAFGSNGEAIGNFSVAFSGRAIGNSSIAFNGGVASGDRAIAMNNGATADGLFSIAIGNSIFTPTTASGFASVAIGAGTKASGMNSLALNSETISSGLNSMSVGLNSTASGNIAFSAGYKTVATSYGSFVIGRNNLVEASNATVWTDTDQLFVIGNGTGVTTDPVGVKNRNAFVVYKNGDARFTKRQGDILMGEFGNPE